MKKMLFVILFMSQVLFYGYHTYADDMVEVSEEEYKEIVKSCAIEWATTMEPDYDLQVADISKVNCAYKENAVVYVVNYIQGVTSYGYAMVELIDGEPVVIEAGIQPGEEGVRTGIADAAYEKYPDDSIQVSKEVISLEPMEHVVEVTVNGDEKYMDASGKEYSDTSVHSNEAYGSHASLYISSENFNDTSQYVVNQNTVLVLSKFARRHKVLSKYQLSVNSGKFACGIHSMIQIAYTEGIFDLVDDNYYFSQNEIRSIYDYLWDNAEAWYNEEQDPEKRYKAGGSDVYKTADALVKYAKYKGKTNSVCTIYEEPSVELIRTKLSQNKTISMSYHINVTDPDEYPGHAITVFGVKNARKVVSGNNWNYLMVADGMNDTITYLNYSTVDFIWCKIACFYIN